jgi:hypothetical protein
MQHLRFNPWAVVVAALFQWFLGALWYSPPLFAKPWMALLGIKKGSSSKGMMTGMISSFICDLILCFVLAHFVLWSGAKDWSMGALVGFISWAGFIVGPNLPQGIYESRPFTLFAINSGYWLLGLVGAGILLAVWR